jgi:FKBP-type peptidyl-prolyl cis-trans isomerase
MKLNLLVATYSLVLCVVVLTSACAKKEESNTPAQAPAITAVTSQPVVAEVTDMKIEDMKAGTGAVAEAGKRVTVHYTGWLTNGTKFDSSKDHGQPFNFQLGAGQVIKGWDQGVAGMKVGGMRKLTIPPSLRYGANGTGGVIPPNATLVFEVELLGVN